MASYSRSAGASSPATTMTPATSSSNSQFSTIDTIAKVRKPSRVIRKLSRPLEKSSLDLDRTSTEQGLGVCYAGDNNSGHDFGPATRSSHDLTWNSNTRAEARRAYHQRSTSGTSQFSTQTSGSYNRNGSFQHPWQQTPRPYTPPAATSYQGSVVSEFDRQRVSFADDERLNLRSTSTLSNHTLGGSVIPTRRDNLTLNTKSSERLKLALGTSSSSNLALNPNLASFSAETSATVVNTLSSPNDTISPSSFRSSMDRTYRLRSRSDAGAAEMGHSARGQIETIREARRKFEERERAKEERAAKDQVKAIEKRNLKEARRAEGRARKSTASERSRGRGDSGMNEKAGGSLEVHEGLFVSDYDSAPVQTPPATEPAFGPLPPPRRKAKATAAKKKTHSAWTTFMMWLRTRLLRMSKKR